MNAATEIRLTWKPERAFLAQQIRAGRQQIPQALAALQAGQLSQEGIVEVVRSLRGQVRGTWGTTGFSHKNNLTRLAQLRIRESVLRRLEAKSLAL